MLPPKPVSELTDGDGEPSVLPPLQHRRFVQLVDENRLRRQEAAAAADAYLQSLMQATVWLDRILQLVIRHVEGEEHLSGLRAVSELKNIFTRLQEEVFAGLQEACDL